jgi:hypothetical protein
MKFKKLNKFIYTEHLKVSREFEEVINLRHSVRSFEPKKIPRKVLREIKIMPDTASRNALIALETNACSPSNNCTIQLKTVGNGDAEKIQYEMNLEKRTKILGVIPQKMRASASVDAQTGETRARNPWWAFMAKVQSE